MDRYLCKNNVEIGIFQLVGIASMFIATKYEEIYAPEIRDFLHICKNLYTREQILHMEYKIMKSINFELLTISPYIFLVRFHFISGDTKQTTFHLPRYILDTCLLNIHFCKYNSSIKAASVLFIARKMMKIDNDTPWNSALKIHTGVSEHELKPCIKEILKFLKKSLPGLKGKSIYNKYNTHSHHYVSKMIEEGACNKSKKSD